MHFLRLLLAFIQKLCLLSFHFPKINKRDKSRGIQVGIKAGGGGLENFSKINKRGRDDYSVLESRSEII